MSLLNKLKAKVNPKAKIKAEFKKRLPQIKDDLNLMLDDLFMQVAEQNQSNPFELALILHKKESMAVGSFFSAEQKEIAKIDAGALIQELFMRQLSVIPEMFKEAVLSELGTENVSPMILKALKGKRLLIRYDENEEFCFVEVTKNGNKTIDLNEFLNTFEF
jgi:hypothetical protein